MSVERPCCYRTSVSPRPLRQLSVIIEPAAAGLDPVTSHPGVGAKALIRHQTRFPLKHPPPLRYLLDVGWKIGKDWVGLYRRHGGGSITLRRYCSYRHSRPWKVRQPIMTPIPHLRAIAPCTQICQKIWSTLFGTLAADSLSGKGFG